ncbi:uncharacterized protein [Argopecten irradians]|uniref:uncharacterized protein n=1 Tax=Argopecten irradians TaxID=31199 RepID=UPI003724B5C1
MASMNANVSGAFRRGQISSHQQFRSGKSLFSLLMKKKDGPKKSNPVKMQRERVRQFSIWFEEREQAKDREYIRRRRKREANREEVARATGRLKLLYLPTSILLFTGLTILFLSVFPGIGSDTVFWKKRTIFHVIGPSIVGIGVLMLMVTEAILSRRKAHLVRLRRIENLECTQRQKAITQEPCEHQQQLLDTYFKSGKTCACRFDLLTVGRKKPTVSVETQTDEILLLEFVQQKIYSKGSFRKGKKKLCKMESVDSAAYSMESSATCFTDLYDEDENEPLLMEDNPHLPVIAPSIPNITYGGSVMDSTQQVGTNTGYYQQYQDYLPPVESFENETNSNQNLPLPADCYRGRANSEGHINRSFEYGMDKTDSTTGLCPKPSCLNSSVPNLKDDDTTGLLSLDPVSRRASWTTFE